MTDFATQNKSGWVKVAFGDVVRKVSDRVDPASSGLERYVAGEHMVTDELKITNWGLIGEDYLGPAFHMRFKPGQVLYGSRRTYLRKVALPDFEGITANTTYVLESSDPSKLMPELLPYIMQTESFHAHSIANSKGSVNPYVNYSDIACFKFMLPPLQEQARTVQLLQSFGRLEMTLKDLLSSNRVVEQSFLQNEFVSKSQKNDAQNFKLVSDLGTVIRGSSPRPKGDKRYYGGKVPRLLGEDVTRDGMYVTPKIDTLTEEGAKRSRPVSRGTVVIICSGDVGTPSILATDACIHDGFIAVIDLDDSVSNEYLFIAFKALKSEFLRLRTEGGIWSNLTTDTVKNFTVPIPPRQQMSRIEVRYRSIVESQRKILHRLSELEKMKSSLLNKYGIFSPL